MFASESSSQAPLYQPEKVKYPTISVKETFEVVTTVAAPILLLSALGLSIYFALRPLPPLVPVLPNYSFSLPLLICTASGLASSFVFIVQMVRYKSLQEPFENLLGQFFNWIPPLQKAVRFGVHPGGRTKGTTTGKYREANQSTIDFITSKGFKPVSFSTRKEEDVNLSGYWYQNERPTGPTVIYCHGNLMTAEDTPLCWVNHYKELGFNILVLEYRGYGLSEGVAGEPNQELEAYLDAEAAYKFALSQGIDPSLVVAHGLSLGGAYAAALGYFFNVKCVVMERSFTSVAGDISHLSRFSQTFSQKIVEASYLRCRKEHDPEIPEAKELITDGFDSLAKVQKMPGDLFVIQSRDDEIMDVEFGSSLVQARYPDDEKMQKDCLAIVGGVHGDSESFFEQKESVQQLDRFLQAHLNIELPSIPRPRSDLYPSWVTDLLSAKPWLP